MFEMRETNFSLTRTSYIIEEPEIDYQRESEISSRKDFIKILDVLETKETSDEQKEWFDTIPKDSP